MAHRRVDKPTALQTDSSTGHPLGVDTYVARRGWPRLHAYNEMITGMTPLGIEEIQAVAAGYNGGVALPDSDCPCGQIHKFTARCTEIELAHRRALAQRHG